MKITDALMRNYLPYAKGVIVSRAIPDIDGLKPSQRKILYTMYLMKLLDGDKTKSTNIVGQTMKLHPHGDQSIYETMVHMTSGNETLNVPYIESKGNFGKVYSRDLAYAASRYTEAKLAKICKEMFDGIDEDAVEFESNYDDTMMEPKLLPVKFPTILVNSSSGIAVGMGSTIPSFGLKNVCMAVVGILEGKINNEDELISVLGIPEFPTGAIVNADKKMMVDIAKTGTGSITMTSSVDLYSDRIVVNEIPYKTTVEAIISATEAHVKSGELKEVTGTSDETGLDGFKLVINFKPRSDPREVLRKMCYYTPLRCNMSFCTRVIINNKCVPKGLLDLLRDWIDFRENCIRRVYTFRFNKESRKEHLLTAWEKLEAHIHEAGQVIFNNTEEMAIEVLTNQWGLDTEQAEYIMDMKAREFTSSRLKKHLNDLANSRALIAEYRVVMDDKNERYKLIIQDQERIIKTYAKDNKTHIGRVVDLEAEREREKGISAPVAPDSSMVDVVISKNGYMKRLATANMMVSYELPDNEELWYRITTRNNHQLLVFTVDGSCHKVQVNDIDSGRGKLKDTIQNTIGVPLDRIVKIDDCGEYDKTFNIIHGNGRGYIVDYSKASGKRRVYKNLFEPVEGFWYSVMDSNQFFLVTRARKAAYVDVDNMRRRADSFKLPRITGDDDLITMIKASNVPDISKIDLTRYKNGYAVSIGSDELWKGASESWERIKEYKKAVKLKKSQLKKQQKAE